MPTGALALAYECIFFAKLTELFDWIFVQIPKLVSKTSWEEIIRRKLEITIHCLKGGPSGFQLYEGGTNISGTLLVANWFTWIPPRVSKHAQESSLPWWIHVVNQETPGSPKTKLFQGTNQNPSCLNHPKKKQCSDSWVLNSQVWIYDETWYNINLNNRPY